MRKPPSSDQHSERPRGGPARQVADLVPAAGRSSFRRFGFVQAAIVSRWGEIVGQRYADVSAPESLRFPPGKRAEGVLTLSVVSAFAPTMQHVLPEIVTRVNRFFGYEAVARVVLKQAPMLTPRTAPAPPPALGPVPDHLGESLKTIGDPELRAVLESLARGVAAQAMPVVGKVG